MSDAPKKSKGLGRLLLWVVLGSCIAISALAAIGNANRPAVTAQATQGPAAAAVGPTESPAPTDRPAPTSPPVSTSTPALPTETPVSALGAVGERREAGGIGLTVIAVEYKAELSSFQKAEPGKLFVVVEVLIENISRDTTPYNPFYFKVKDADGFEYTIAFSTAENTLKSGELPQGDKARGTVAFSVNEAATGLVLSYEPLVLLGGYEPIKIALGPMP